MSHEARWSPGWAMTGRDVPDSTSSEMEHVYFFLWFWICLLLCDKFRITCARWRLTMLLAEDEGTSCQTQTTLAQPLHDSQSLHYLFNEWFFTVSFLSSLAPYKEVFSLDSFLQMSKGRGSVVYHLKIFKSSLCELCKAPPSGLLSDNYATASWKREEVSSKQDVRSPSWARLVAPFSCGPSSRCCRHTLWPVATGTGPRMPLGGNLHFSPL